MSESHLSRRDFLAGSALAWPAALAACSASISSAQEPWAAVRAQFLIPDDRIYLNIGTLGPQPVGNTAHGGIGLRINY